MATRVDIVSSSISNKEQQNLLITQLDKQVQDE